VKEANAAERIAFLGGEPDRWRNNGDPLLQHMNNPDHYFDVEDLAPLEVEAVNLPPFRYDFVALATRMRATHPERFPVINPATDPNHTRAQVGFLPWSITEGFARLKSAFSSLKTFEEDGTPAEIANARDNVVQYMGVLSHWVADSAQPLHTTRNFNGWMDGNPSNFTTNRTFHAWIDGGYLEKIGLPTVDELRGRLRPGRVPWIVKADGTNFPVFATAVAYVMAQHKLVVPLYQLEKEGKFTGEGEDGRAGRVFLETQFVTAAQMLGDLWFSAWREARPDMYLKARLAERKARSQAPSRK
ncbi:MAG TPA: hypothetical protein VHH73_09325, partial [Verrucomicrobiae bacterium]|nr:hypothetical protein [Verrucomicrobiae bacterium]